MQTCGAYFSKGSAGRKLDRFLAYLQRYLAFKAPLPLDVEFDVQACPFPVIRRSSLSIAVPLQPPGMK